MDHDQRIRRALADVRPCGLISQFGRWQADLGAPAKHFAARMSELRVPGVGLAVLDGGEVVWRGGLGERVSGGGAVVTAETLFQAGSISKPVFALAVMCLVEQGRVDLDEDVAAYLTSWRVPCNGPWRPRVTLRRLLSHTAGATVHGFPGYLAGGPIPTLVEVLNGGPPANTPPVVIDLLPGSQQRYAGGGTTVAQQAIVDLLGRPFPEVMDELVLGPVGMTRSSYAQPPPDDLAAEAASGHDANGVEVRGRWHIYPEMAAAGLWTTATDMGRLGVELMKILRGCPSRLGLSPNSVAEMLKPQLPDQAVGGEFIGLGWVCDGAGEAFSFGHTGGDEGFIADFKLFPHLGAGGVIMTNGMQGSVLFSEALSSIGREYKWPGDPAPRPSMPTVLAKGLASDWESSSGRRIAVTEARGGAWLEFADQPPIELRACADDEVFAVGLNLRLRLGDGGSTLRWVQPGKLIRFERTLTAKGQPSPGIG